MGLQNSRNALLDFFADIMLSTRIIVVLFYQ